LVVSIALAHLGVGQFEAVLRQKLRLDLAPHVRRLAPSSPLAIVIRPQPLIVVSAHHVNRDDAPTETIGCTIKGTKVEAVLHARISDL
jgi:hypothetical protein